MFLNYNFFNNKKIFLFILIFLSIIKYFIINLYYDFGSIFEFGQIQIGSTVKSLQENFSFIHCDDLRLDVCSHAKVMPFPAIMVATLGLIFNNSLSVVLISKTFLLDSLLILHIYFFDKKFKINIFSKLCIIVLFSSPQYMLHSYAGGQPEGFLIQLFPITFIIMCFLIYKSKKNINIPIYYFIYIIVLINFLVFTKFSQIFIFLLYLVYIFYFIIVSKKNYYFLILLLFISIMPLILWGKINYDRYGFFKFSSSENMISFYMGNNEYLTKLYPKYQVDWITTKESVIINHKIIKLTNFENQKFINEWERSEFFRQKAFDWIFENPNKFLINNFYKLYAIFLEPRNFPIEDPKITYLDLYKNKLYVIGLLFMLIIKITVIFIIFKFLLYNFNSLFKLHNNFILFSAAFFLAPYLIGFAYQRHLIPLFLVYFLINSLIGNKNLDKNLV